MGTPTSLLRVDVDDGLQQGHDAVFTILRLHAEVAIVYVDGVANQDHMDFLDVGQSRLLLLHGKGDALELFAHSSGMCHSLTQDVR